MSKLEAGVCKIKSEYVVKKGNNDISSININSGNKHKLSDCSPQEEQVEIASKKACLDNETKNSKPKDKKRGQNKARPKTYRDDKESKPCPSIINILSKDALKPCQFNNCKFIHDPIKYLKIKPKDISDHCHVYNLRGCCPRGLSCRFGSNHITLEGFNMQDAEKVKQWKDDTKNTMSPTLQTQLQKKKYNFDLAEKLVKSTDKRNKDNDNSNNISNQTTDTVINGIQTISGAITDEDIVKLLPREKKTIDWKDKLYLSPLTTVGNLPFRRICKEFGVDITCGEMALCESLLKGMKQEWALVKRHECEDVFGVQLCANNPYGITKVAQLLNENTDVSFVDLNMGCPIDLVYKKGGGCGMMHRLPSLEASVRCASKVLSVPFTLKMRTGVYQDKKIAHTIVPKVAEWGASLVTIHGRSREARYTRSSDWEYIETCAKAAAPCPVFGNGDILCYQDYTESRSVAPSVQGVMIGRGALIKPWIFTEIKEHKIWDISSKERFDIIKKYTNYGLEHWGSDTQGVENTRRFLLEWLSFLYRYVPVGLLEQPPQRINERPPTYFGRDDLETLMASGNCSDWIKISEMLLGPVPDGFVFLPKHKANSY